jgi:hypothetical protein
VQVDGGAGVRKGTAITPIAGTGTHLPAEAGERQQHHTVTAIQGDRIIFTHGLRQSYREGDRLISSFPMVAVTSRERSDIEVTGFVFDGNRRGNLLYFAWPRHPSLILRGDGLLVHGNHFFQSPNDCISTSGARDVVIAGNSFRDIGGAAIHLSGIEDLLITANEIAGTGSRSDLSGHTEGAITYSTHVYDAHLTENTIIDADHLAIGTMNLVFNKGLVIENNFICQSRRFFKAALRMPSMLEEPGNITLRNNEILLSGPGLVLVSEGLEVTGIEISGNRLIDTGFWVGTDPEPGL